jgi:hypothetical protein
MQSKRRTLSCTLQASRKALARQLLGENPQLAVHILTDDPSYVLWFKRQFAAEMQQTPARITLGVNTETQILREHAAHGQMRSPQPTRMTSLTAFFKDVWLMVRCNKFYPTQGSTVTGVVAGYRLALGLPPNEQGAIGSWQGYEQPSGWSMKNVRGLLQLVAASDFDPSAQHMNVAQREVLKKFSDVDCSTLDAFLAEKVGRGFLNPSSWMSQLYQSNRQIAENRAKFQAAFTADSVEGGVKHWLGAVLAHRVNNYLLRSGSKYVWKLERSGLEQVPLAFPEEAVTMMGEPTAADGGSVPQASSTGSVFVPSMETAASGSGGPPKRQRFAEEAMPATTSKAASSASPPAAAAAARRGRSPPQLGATAKPLPKPMPGRMNRTG